MAETLKVAVLGMAHDHLWSNVRELGELDGVDLVAGADGNPELQAKFSARIMTMF